MLIALFAIYLPVRGAMYTAPAVLTGAGIAVDAGHGGVDGGTGCSGLLEKDINLDIALRLRTVLEKKGYRIIMTREADEALDKRNTLSKSRHKRDLIARTHIINSGCASVFISIHVNSNFNDPSMDGSYVFYNAGSEDSKDLALHIQRALNSINVRGEPRTKNAPLAGRYHILVNSKIPGVLVETAFISNNRERELLKTEEFRQRLAEAIADGADSYLMTSE